MQESGRVGRQQAEIRRAGDMDASQVGPDSVHHIQHLLRPDKQPHRFGRRQVARHRRYTSHSFHPLQPHHQLIALAFRPAPAAFKRPRPRSWPLGLTPPRRPLVPPKLPLTPIPPNIEIPDPAPRPIAPCPAIPDVPHPGIEGHLDAHPRPRFADDFANVARERTEAFAFGRDDAWDPDVEGRARWEEGGFGEGEGGGAGRRCLRSGGDGVSARASGEGVVVVERGCDNGIRVVR